MEVESTQLRDPLDIERSGAEITVSGLQIMINICPLDVTCLRYPDLSYSLMRRTEKTYFTIVTYKKNSSIILVRLTLFTLENLRLIFYLSSSVTDTYIESIAWWSRAINHHENVLCKSSTSRDWTGDAYPKDRISSLTNEIILHESSTFIKIL